MTALDWLPKPAWVFFAAVLGLALGSFAGLVVDRLPRMVLGQSELSLRSPPSHCTSCGQRLRWWHNVPVFSYLLLRGRCGFCGASIGWLTLGIEVVFGVLWAVLVADMGPTPKALVWASFFSVLLVLLVIDWQTMLLPDAITWPLMLMGLLCSWGGYTTLSFEESLLGAILGYLMLWAVAWFYERMRGFSGMGGGDPKLMAALGAWLGPLALANLLLGSSVLHIAFCALNARFNLGFQALQADESPDALPKEAVPMGPAIVIAAMLFWCTQASAGNTAATGYPFKVETVQAGEAVQVIARNEGEAVVSVEVQLEGRNVASDRAWPLILAVPANTHLPLATLFAAQPGTAFDFNIRSARTFGDLQAQLDPTPFRLPYRDGDQFAIGQAYGSRLSTHQDPVLQHAVDFDMPEDTPVVAAREGLVVDMQTGFTRGAPDPRFADMANWIKLLHSDGTVATYAHLSPKPLLVALGSRVRAGQIMGYSGNTGYSSGPHLHFCVAKPMVTAAGMTESCLPVRFSTGRPAQIFSPQEGLVVMASDSGPAYVGQKKQNLQGFTASAWVPAAPMDERSAHRGWLDDFPWWGWLLLAVLVPLLVIGCLRFAFG